MNDVIVT